MPGGPSRMPNVGRVFGPLEALKFEEIVFCPARSSPTPFVLDSAHSNRGRSISGSDLRVDSNSSDTTTRMNPQVR